MLRDIFESNASPATSFKANIKRKKEAEPPQAQAPSFRLAAQTRELRKQSPYEEERYYSDSGSSSDGDCVVGSDGGNLEAEVEAEATKSKKRMTNKAGSFWAT